MDEVITSYGRATTIEELDVVMGKYFSKESRERGLAFQPKNSDIIISPYAKCGTTWIQQIAHGLRTRGSMDFDEINSVTPWIEIADDVGWDIRGSQVAEPRVYKSHTGWDEVPKGGKYIVSFRHYQDAMISFYRFFEGYFFEPGTITLEELIDWRWPQEELTEFGYWHHLISWWEQRDNKDVLLLCYENMKGDHEGTVKKIANFMGIRLDDELIEIVVRQSSRDFMLAHKDQFDEKHSMEICGKRAGLPPSNATHKITQGVSNDARYLLSPALKEMLDGYWQDLVQAKFGFSTYEALCEELRLS